MLYHVLHFKGEAKKGNFEIVKYKLYLWAHNGSGFDSYIDLNDISHWRTVVSLIKNCSGFVSLKRFHGYVDENKKNPLFVHFRCGEVHINKSLKKICESHKFEKSLLKQEMDHEEVNEDTWEDKEHEWLLYLKNGVLSNVLSHAI